MSLFDDLDSPAMLTSRQSHRVSALDDHRLYTIGVYGFTKQTFHDALDEARIDAVVDIRRRRGVRGREYSFSRI